MKWYTKEYLREVHNANVTERKMPSFFLKNEKIY